MTKRLAHSAHPGRDVRMTEHGGRVSDAAKALGWTYDNTKHVWRRVRERMGAQSV
jgi:transposase-like protein